MQTYDLIEKNKIQSEADRLRAQVMLGWALEKKKLEEFGKEKNITLLDLGCGPGVFSELVGEAFPQWNVVGVDNNADLLPKTSTFQNVSFLPSGANNEIPLSDASVDIVYCRFLFQHLTDKTQVLSEISRVLRPGGFVVAIDVDDRGVVFSPEQDWINRIYEGAEKVQGALRGDRFIGAALPQVFVNAGFEAVAFDVIPMTNFRIPSETLLYLAFGLKRRFLESDPETAPLVSDLDQNMASFMKIAGHVVYIPIFFCAGRKPRQK